MSMLSDITDSIIFNCDKFNQVNMQELDQAYHKPSFDSVNE